MNPRDPRLVERKELERKNWMLVHHAKLAKMAARIQRIARHALSTFMIGETTVFSSNFEKLKALVSKRICELTDSKASLLF